MIEKEALRLEEIARKARIEILKMLNCAASGHTGGSLSVIDILTVLYFSKMKHDPKNLNWDERDMFVLSKGHGAPALYVCLGECGYFDTSHYKTLRKFGSMLSGHPVSNIPGVDVSTGSLGQGLSQGNGIALARRLEEKKSRVYVVMGDGEINEGQVWEAALTSSHYKIDTLCAIIDNNGLQIDGTNKEIKNIEPIADKWRAFGWEVFEIDGHNMSEILNALDACESVNGKPSLILAKTIKGKGVSFMENQVKYHGIAPTNEELEKALKELERKS